MPALLFLFNLYILLYVLRVLYNSLHKFQSKCQIMLFLWQNLSMLSFSLGIQIMLAKDYLPYWRFTFTFSFFFFFMSGSVQNIIGFTLSGFSLPFISAKVGSNSAIVFYFSRDPTLKVSSSPWLLLLWPFNWPLLLIYFFVIFNIVFFLLFHIFL